MKTSLLIAGAFVLLLAASPAQACQACCVPPPYDFPNCCYTICGTTGCLLTSSGGWGYVCTPQGNPCSDNDDYCNGHPYLEPDGWAQCSPLPNAKPLAERWQLMAVDVKHTSRHT
jgi:hypothetical protein